MLGDWAPMAHHFYSEDLAELNRMLVPETYHVVVANPPYITPKDRALNTLYRKRYKTCHMKYSLAVPFMERIFQLAVERGFTGQITANSFMKREFGKKLIEEFFPKINLTHVIDTSGAYIPGHGTPTVILFGQNRRPIASVIRTVMGIKGEPGTPDNPVRGKVWSAILAQVDHVGSQSAFVSVTDSLRELFHKHPWSIGGGGASELQAYLDESSSKYLSDVSFSIGFMAIVSEDDAYVAPHKALKRLKFNSRPFIRGEDIRDWSQIPEVHVILPYRISNRVQSLEIKSDEPLGKHFWRVRTTLRNRTMFGKTPEAHGNPWYAYMQMISRRALADQLIAFTKVATHSQFCKLDKGSIPNEHAPVILLRDDEHQVDCDGLIGLLNSSTACFWIKQVSHNKGSTVDQRGARQTTVAFENFWEHDGTKLKKFPIPATASQQISSQLNSFGHQHVKTSPDAILKDLMSNAIPLSEQLKQKFEDWQFIQQQMIALQEEIDWQCYQLYELLEEDLTHPDPPPIALGQRAFEIVMARRMAAGELQTTWFERHNSIPITELPSDWSDDYKQLVQKRIELIESDRNIGLIEQPEYKRRWNTEPWDAQLERASREWLCDRLETYFDFDGRMNEEGKPTSKIEISLVSIAQLADLARHDPEFLRVGELYRKDAAFDVLKLVAELVEAESVPLLPVLRYKPSGLRKHDEWKETWKQQRLEDAIDARTKLPKDHPDYVPESAAKWLKKQEIGDISVPPKYTSSDFQKSHYWKLRGKLDVPKERWVSFPHCNAEDGTIMIAWAGCNHLQLAQSISTYFITVKEELGGRNDPRLPPLLASLIELLPWLKQWHNDLDPTYNLVMSDYFESFIQDEARDMGKTLDEVSAWQPPAKTGRRRT